MTQPDLNPIIRDSAVPFFGFRALSNHSRGNTRIVYIHDGGLSESGGRLPSLRERLRKSYRLFEIDTAHHPITLKFELPSAEEAFRFRVTMYLTWAVHGPDDIARLGIRDVKAIFWPFLDQRLRPLSRQHAIESCAMAEDELNSDLKAAPFMLDQGIVLSSCAVDLSLDDRAQEHLARRTESRRAREQALLDHDLRLLQDRHDAELADLRRQLEQLDAAHRLNLKQQRMDFYVKALERDGVGFVILQLIEHPEDISAVISMLERRNDNSFEKARKVISDLMGADLYNPADLDPIRDHALRRLWEALSASGARWEPEAPSDEMKSGH